MEARERGLRGFMACHLDFGFKRRRRLRNVVRKCCLLVLTDRPCELARLAQIWKLV